MLAFKKRAGVVLLHGGVALVMLSEVLVNTWAVEAQMQLAEGQATNYVQDIRSVELAVVDASAPDHDQVWAIPESLLLSGRTLSDDSLPFRVDLVRFFKNADLRRVKPGERTRPLPAWGCKPWPKICQPPRAPIMTPASTWPPPMSSSPAKPMLATWARTW